MRLVKRVGGVEMQFKRRFRMVCPPLNSGQLVILDFTKGYAIYYSKIPDKTDIFLPNLISYGY